MALPFESTYLSKQRAQLNKQSDFRIAAVQACPVYMDLEGTITKACMLIHEAGSKGADLVVFPEAFVPGYPVWVWFIPPAHTHPLREAYSKLHANSIAIPGHETHRLCDAAREAGVTVAIGVNERNTEASDSTLFNTLLYIGSDGEILGRHRKMIPTTGERLVWGMGEACDLEVYDLPFGKLSGLICWENYMPLARYMLSSLGQQIHVAPTWDRGEPWISTMRHIAKESRCVVVSCCSAVRIDDIPDDLSFKGKYLGAIDEWINPGGTAILDPDGKYLAGPAEKEEVILYADIEHDQLVGPRWQLDIAGHYSRPDIFQLRVNRTPRTHLEFVTDADVTSDDFE